MTFRGDWNYPTTIKAGRGRRAELGGLLHELGVKRPLFVSDPGFASLAFVPELRDQLARSAFISGLFTALRSNPVGANVLDGVRAFREGDHDSVVAIGGGSALDVGKAIAMYAGQRGALFDYEDVGDRWLSIDGSAIAPIVALPTTAGTGSEVGRASVITDESTRTKKILFHPKMLPSRVILDSELCYGLPPFLTAATGMDALSHSLEAFCAPGFHPMAVGIALEGMRLVHHYLEVAFAEPTNDEARLAMLSASSMGATAFQRGLGAMHALAHPLGALYDAHHGALNAVLMPYVLVANRPNIESRIGDAARYLDLPAANFDGFLSRVLALRDSLGIPHTLVGLGIDAHEKARIGRLAVADPSASTNPIAFEAKDYERIFVAAVEGKL